jgi:hypothetical protein
MPKKGNALLLSEDYSPLFIDSTFEQLLLLGFYGYLVKFVANLMLVQCDWV